MDSNEYSVGSTTTTLQNAKRHDSKDSPTEKKNQPTNRTTTTTRATTQRHTNLDLPISTMSTTTLSPAFQQLVCEMIAACAKNDPNAFLSSYQTLRQQLQSTVCEQPSSEISENPSNLSESKIVQDSTFDHNHVVDEEQLTNSKTKVSKRYTKLRKQLKACENFKDNYFVFSTTTTKDSHGKKKRNATKKRSKEGEESSSSGSEQESSPNLTTDSKKRKVTEIPTDQSSSLETTSSLTMDSSFDQQYQQLMNTWVAQQCMNSSVTATQESAVTHPQNFEILEEQAVPDFFSNTLELDSLFNNPTTDLDLSNNFTSSSLINLPETSFEFDLFSELL